MKATFPLFTQYFIFIAFLSLMTFVSANAQNNKPAFKILDRDKPAKCKGKGASFLVGYLSAPKPGNVVISLFFQHSSGYWEKREIMKNGTGKIDLNITDCDYTGNYYVFANYEDDKTAKVPTELEVENSHKAKDQTPKFKPSNPEKSKCTDGTGTEKLTFKDGFVYSPKGGTVDITFFVETKEGKWRKKHILYDGTGTVPLNVYGCDLTGNYKILIEYVN